MGGGVEYTHDVHTWQHFGSKNQFLNFFFRDLMRKGIRRLDSDLMREGIRRLDTPAGQVAHVNLRNHDFFWSVLFALSFFAIISYSMHVKPPEKAVYQFPKVSRHMVFVLDNSYSMHGEPLKDLQTAVNAFLTNRQKISQNDKVSIIVFNNDADEIMSLESISSGTSCPNLLADGATSYSAGLRKALTALKRTPKNMEAEIVFMSDGYPTDWTFDRQEAIENIQNWSINTNTSLFAHCVPFGDQGGQATLRDMCSVLKGRYIPANTGNDLKKAFGDIGSYASYDDAAASLIFSLNSKDFAAFIPIFVAIALFYMYVLFLKTFAMILVLLLNVGVILTVITILLIFCHNTKFFSETSEICIVLVAFIAICAYTYWVYGRAKLAGILLLLFKSKPWNQKREK